MDIALVEHAEDDVYREERRKNEPGLIRERSLERLCCSLKTAMDIRRHSHLPFDFLHCVHGLTKRHSLGEIERQGDRGKLSLMIDALRGQTRFVVNKRTQRDFDAICRSHVNILERVGILLIRQFGFHHDVILIQWLVHRRDLPLAKRGVQSIIDNLGRDADPRCRIAVNDESSFQSPIGQVRVRIANLGKRLDAIEHDPRPFLQILNRVGLDRVLELRIAASAADPQFLRRLKEHRRARQLQFGTQARDHLVRGHVAFCERLQLNIHLSESARALN